MRYSSCIEVVKPTKKYLRVAARIARQLFFYCVTFWDKIDSDVGFTRAHVIGVKSVKIPRPILKQDKGVSPFGVTRSSRLPATADSEGLFGGFGSVPLVCLF